MDPVPTKAKQLESPSTVIMFHKNCSFLKLNELALVQANLHSLVD